ncbi:MAG: protoheme IX farnesyltransferase [Verrucomicrobiota bacterium]
MAPPNISTAPWPLALARKGLLELKLARFYLALVKLPQTGLLLFTAWVGFRSAQGMLPAGEILAAMAGMLLALSGTTAINMFFDRDIDSIMDRTKGRPLPTNTLSPRAVLLFGTGLIVAGMWSCYAVSPLYGHLVLAGVFFDLVIYTFWLKRRSPWSIVFGGVAGGMPIIAGRALALGHIDGIGLLMALAILLWIPTHLLTLAMNRSAEYKLAGVPAFPNVYGFKAARHVMAACSLAVSGIMLAIFMLTGVCLAGMAVLVAANLVLVGLSVWCTVRPSKKANFLLFKYASLYMVCAMFVLML